jgi:hypothetical protein
MVAWHFVSQTIGAELRQTEYPVQEWCACLSPALSESTNKCKLILLPSSLGTLGGIGPTTSP